MPLSEVSRILVGRQTVVFQRKRGEDVARDVASFSLDGMSLLKTHYISFLLLGKRTLDLEAGSRLVREAWVEGLRLLVNPPPGQSKRRSSSVF
jgi:hypothetical protein